MKANTSPVYGHRSNSNTGSCICVAPRYVRRYKNLWHLGSYQTLTTSQLSLIRTSASEAKSPPRISCAFLSLSFAEIGSDVVPRYDVSGGENRRVLNLNRKFE